MKIKKMYQGTAPENKILNTYSDSQTDVYSCDYTNKLSNYSTEEQVIGTWINGKPVYKKTFVGRYESGSVLIENVDVLVDVEGQADSGGNKRLIPYYELYSGSIYEAKLQIDTQNRLVTATQVNSTSTAYNWAVTVKYTKTTN